MLLPMSADLYVALLAIFRLGMVALILDPSAGWNHTERCCALYPPQALIAGTRAHLLRLLSPALRRIPFKVSVELSDLGPCPGGVSFARRPFRRSIPAIRRRRAPYLHERQHGATKGGRALARILARPVPGAPAGSGIEVRRRGHHDSPRLRPGQPGIRCHQRDAGSRPAPSGFHTSRTPCRAGPCAPRDAPCDVPRPAGTRCELLRETPTGASLPFARSSPEADRSFLACGPRWIALLLAPR